jgi:hypothetical protein
MNTIDLTELIPRCHEASKANGWWEPRPNAGQQLMLVVSELSEALEADRNGDGKRDGLQAYANAVAFKKSKGFHLDQAFFPEDFKGLVKDSVGDELADAYIRLCDFAGGFEISNTDWLMGRLNWWRGLSGGMALALPGNFGASLLLISGFVIKIQGEAGDPPSMLCAALFAIEALCAREGIDLATHIDLKLQFNATRGQKHGGKAY